ncbi:MAG: hypothetical protein EXS08_12555 [Planctomycetes bacterium]|nr:hypothetical protein [Planctomycetota bacterium]
MAGIQASNQLLDLLRALKRRRYQVLVPALLVSTVGIAFAVIVPKTYSVSTRIEITDRLRADSDSRLKNPQDVSVRREATSAFDHIVHFQRVKEVLEGNYALWPEYVALRSEGERQQFIRERVLANLNAFPTIKDSKGGSGTIFVDITYRDENKERAARFLSELSESWLREMLQSDRTTLTNNSEQLQELVDAQGKDLGELDFRYFQVMQLLGQDPSAPSGEGRRDDHGDWTFKMLEKARTDATEVEFQLETAQFDLQQAQANLLKTPDKLQKPVPIKAGAPAVELKQKQALLEALEEKLAGLTPLNSSYKKLKPKLDELAQEIEELARIEPETIERWEEEPNPLFAAYEAAVRTQTDLVGRLSQQRDALAAAIKDLEDETKMRNERYQQLDELQNQVSEARQRMNETTRKWHDSEEALQMLDSAPQPWRIAQPPVPSSAKTTPNPLLLGGVSVVLGLALGMGLALLSELAKSSYRSVSDLASVMSVPVLGAIETIVTRRERRRLQASRAFAALSTAVIVGSIGWVTWLWASAPERLPLELQDAIERVRSALK